jgi:thiol-disulfide isomerase/thioredoxin
MNARIRPIALLVCLLASTAVHAAQIKETPQVLAPNETRLHYRIEDVSFILSDGKLSRLSDYSGKAIVIAFTSPTCPVALRYRPRLTELADRFKGKVEFLIINCRADSNAALTAALSASSTTEVFFLDSARTVLYRGAVDDQYGLGYQLDAPRQTFLIDAIDSLLASRPIGTPTTTAPGCLIECKINPKPSPVTFHNRISRIIQFNCQECHRPGEPAPFNLLTYDDAKSHAKTIKRVVERKTMPPWFAEGGHWANDRRLSDADRNDLFAWIDAGCPEGDPAHAPLARTWETGWRIGKPDAIFEVPRPIKVRAQGTMPYQDVVVATGLPEDKWVKAVEIRSTQPQVTHHILVFEVYPPDHPRDTNARPKYLAGLTGYFAGMVPGQGHIVFPENTAKFLPKGAGLHFQIHYTPNGTACEDKPKIGLLYADAPPKHELLTRSVATTKFLIPANASNHIVTATKTFTEPTRIFSFNPHSHVRGKAFKYELVMPDGARTTLLDLPHYDFNWQIDYRLKEPLDVPIRSKLVVTAWYDNSKNNPANPDPNKDVGWGDQTWDEMMIGYYTRHSLAPIRVGSTPVAATASPPVAVEGADSETRVLKTPDGKPLKRITQPGDLIFASSGNSRGSEGVANAIDNNKNTKYLNWDSGRDGDQIGTFSPSGFAVQPAVGPTVVTGMGIQSANDASDRDPDVVVLEGSNDPSLTSYESGTWTSITTISNIAAGFAARFQSQEFFFSNTTPYRNYRWRVEATRIMPNRCCMQVAEVWLTTSAPSNQAASPANAGLGR